jgi:hypothetical protein
MITKFWWIKEIKSEIITHNMWVKKNDILLKGWAEDRAESLSFYWGKMLSCFTSITISWIVLHFCFIKILEYLSFQTTNEVSKIISLTCLEIYDDWIHR